MNMTKEEQFFSILLDKATTQPEEAALWSMLEEIAPTKRAKVFFQQYSDFLQSRQPKRYYQSQDVSRFESQGKVTFVVLSGLLRARVEKLAQTAVLAGLEVQLILCFEPTPGFLSQRSLFAQIIVADYFFLRMDEVLCEINNFGSSLIHLFVDCTTNLQAVVWTLLSPLPIVGDPYDVCRVQYDAWPHDPDALRRNVFWEEMWMRHMDGLCLRSLYMKTQRMREVCKKGLPVYHMPEPARAQLCVRNEAHIDDARIRILLDGLCACDPVHKVAFAEIFFAARKAGNVTFHVYRYDGDDVSRYRGMIKTYRRLNVNSFARLMRSCDAFVQPWCMEYVKQSGYSAALGKYCSRGTASDIFEADIVSIMPDYFELLGRNAAKCGRGISFSHDDQKNPQFWRSLAAKVAHMRKTPACYDRFLDATMAPHLRSFYGRVIKRTGHEVHSK